MARKYKSKNRRDRPPPPAGFVSRFQFPLLGLLLLVLVVVAYYPCLRNGYVIYDDPDYAQSNPYVLGGLSGKDIAWAFHDMSTTANWHPLTWMSLMLDCQLFGPQPWGHHLVNLLLHALDTGLLFAILWRVTGATGRCFFVAAFFGLHPLHVQSVAWISERKDVLSTLFWLLAIAAYARYARVVKGGSGKSRMYYWLAFGFFALGLMSKPMLVTLPFTLLLLDYWPLNRWRAGGAHLPYPDSEWASQARHKSVSPREPFASSFAKASAGTPRNVAGATKRLLVEKVPFFALTAVACVVTFAAQKRGGALYAVEPVAISVRLQNALISYTLYVGKLLLPLKLAVFYPVALHSSLLWEVGPAALLLLGISAGAVALVRKCPFVPMGWFWFVGTLVPVIRLVQVGDQMIADRYVYVPSIGFFVALVWGAHELGKKWKLQAPVLPAVAGVILFGCLADTQRETGFWSDNETLFRHAIEVAGPTATAYVNLGMAVESRSNFDEATADFEKAVELDPISVVARNDLGAAFALQGQWEKARQVCEQAVQLEPDYPNAHYDLGYALTRLGRLDEAMAQFKDAIRLKPDDARSHYLLGCALDQRGQADDAIVQLREALRAEPAMAPAHSELAIALLDKGQLDEARAHLDEALRLQPDNAISHNVLGLLLMRKSRFDEAVAQFREALKLKPDFAQARANLARAVHLSEEWLEHNEK